MINLKAVIPVAGLGMHMLPATKAIPKEIGEELMLQALDTARNARPSQMNEKMEISNKMK